MLMNCGHIYFNQMGYLLLFLIKFHINESFMANILSFAEISNVTGVNINMDISKGKVINMHIEDEKSFISKLVQRFFSTPTLMTPPHRP